MSGPLDSLAARIADLERRMSELEGIIRGMSSKPPMRHVTPPRPVYEHSAVSEGKGTLPDHLRGWREFARLHGIGESMMQKAIATGRLAIIVGQWTVGKASVRGALDAAGRAQFVTLYRDNPHFHPCGEREYPCLE